MKVAALFFVFSISLNAAPDLWTYWVQPCSNELARTTHCEAADTELAAWALSAWEQASSGRLAMKPASSETEARLRIYWAGGTARLYGETRPIEVSGKRGAELFIVPDMALAASGDKLYRDTIVYLTCLHESGHAFGLPHNADFEDIMYSFQYGGDIVEYFARYRRKLHAREDIRRTSGLNADDARLISAVR